MSIKKIRHGYTSTSGLSETRKADRQKMAEALAAICKEHGVHCEVLNCWQGKDTAWAVKIQADTGLSTTIDFTPDSIQPNIFVLSWHFNSLPDRSDRGYEINPEVFHDYNNYHFRKATDTAHGWENLKSVVTRRVKQIADGTATVKKQMYHTITLTSAMWSYLYQLYNLNGGEPRKEFGNGHHISVDGLDADWCQPGMQAEYGRARPWRAKDTRVDWKDANAATSAEAELNDFFAGRSKGRPYNGLGDYYVALSEGVRSGKQLMSTSVKASLMYPDRLFAWGVDDENKPLERSQVLKHLKAFGIERATPNYWDPCLVWHGYDKGLPTFHEALRGCTDFGPRWHDVQRLVESHTRHKAYSWDGSYNGGQHGLLVINLNELEEAEK